MAKKPARASVKSFGPAPSPTETAILVADPVAVVDEPSPDGPAPPDEAAPPPLPEAPLTVKDRLFAVVRSIAAARGIETRDPEVWALVEEQFIGPHERMLQRYHRNADENLCHAVENDPSFKEALEIAKGGVF